MVEELGVVLVDDDDELDELVLDELVEEPESELVDGVEVLASAFFESVLVDADDFLSRESFR